MCLWDLHLILLSGVGGSYISSLPPSTKHTVLTPLQVWFRIYDQTWTEYLVWSWMQNVLQSNATTIATVLTCFTNKFSLIWQTAKEIYAFAEIISSWTDSVPIWSNNHHKTIPGSKPTTSLGDISIFKIFLVNTGTNRNLSFWFLTV